MNSYVNDKYVFVYGTLKFGYPLHGHLESMGAEYIGDTVIPNSHLIHLSSFPALILTDKGEKNWAKGEVWAVSTFHSLDIIESVPTFYRRDIVGKARLPGGKDVPLYSYHQTGISTIENPQVIEGGEWNSETSALYNDEQFGFRTMSVDRRERMRDNFDYAQKVTENWFLAEDQRCYPNERTQERESNMTFEQWMKAVDKAMGDLVGLTTADLGDWTYRDAYDDMLSPEDAAREALGCDDLGEMLLEDLEL